MPREESTLDLEVIHDYMRLKRNKNATWESAKGWGWINFLVGRVGVVIGVMALCCY